MSKNIKKVPTQEYEDAVVTVALYVEGLRIGSVPILSQAFHRDATMYGLIDGKLHQGPIKNLYDLVEKNGPAPNIKTRIDVLSITSTTAILRVDVENDAIGANYTDYHTLIKLDETWYIISMVYHRYEE
ncbi:MAG: nuclear transport factor 2 family protein [Candidatus Nitrosocosmicus sp.]|nr:nuclear transport factor 2 family protein [Candidatus Nitrosocosmicus sp.]